MLFIIFSLMFYVAFPSFLLMLFAAWALKARADPWEGSPKTKRQKLSGSSDDSDGTIHKTHHKKHFILNIF